MNHLMLAGRLGADPEVRYTSDGKKITTMRLAVNSRRKGQDVTMWWRVTVWDDQFDRMMQYLKKGSAVMVFGDMQKPEIYNDREGKPQASLEMTARHISFSPFGKGQQSGEATPAQNTQAQPTPQAADPFAEAAQAAAPAFNAAPSATSNFPEDEIPF